MRKIRLTAPPTRSREEAGEDRQMERNYPETSRRQNKKYKG